MVIKNFEYIIIGIIIILIILILIVSSTSEKFEDTTTPSVTTYSKPSSRYNYNKSDSRSKCFDCDNSSNLAHGSNCYDCETKGGRKVDTLLNRVLTR